MAGRVRRRPWAAAGAALLLECATAAFGGDVDLERREIIATGDAVAGGQRIGRSNISGRGIDADGRVLFSAQTSAGVEGLFRVDEHGVETLWTTTTAAARPVRLDRVQTTAGGRVVAAGFPTSQNWGDLLGYYEIAPGLVRPIVEVGDPTPDGDEICSLGEDFVLNDAGAIAFDAWTLPAGADCRTGEGARRLLIADDAGVTTVLRDGTYGIIGLTDRNAVILNSGMAILAARSGRLTAVVTRDSPGPGALREIYGMTSNGGGDVAFNARSGEDLLLLRTDGDRIVRILGTGDQLEDGSRVDQFNGQAWINDAGDVAFQVQLALADGSYRYTTMLAPAAKSPALVELGVGSPLGVNDAGAVALETYAPGRALVRASADGSVPLVGAGDAVPGGGFFLTGGLEGAYCLGGDGRVATVANDQSEREALVCADAGGVTKIARVGDPAPEGGPFAAFSQCAIQDGGPVVFLGAREFPNQPRDWRVYRADADGIATVAGAGTRTADGAVIVSLLPFINFNNNFGEPNLALNARGTVLVKARTDAGDRYLRAYPDGRLESVPMSLGPSHPIRRLGEGGIRDDDTVIAFVLLESEELGIVAAGADTATLLATVSDAILPGGPYDYFSPLLVAGGHALIGAVGSDGLERPLLLTPERVFTLLSAPMFARPIGLTPAGTALFESLGTGRSEYVLADDTGSRTLASFDQPGDPQVIAINDRVNVLFQTWLTSLLTFRQNLALSGPTPAVACPLAPTAPPPPTRTLPATSTVRPTGMPTATLTATLTARPTVTQSSAPMSTPTTVAGADDDGCQIGAPRTTAIGWISLLPALILLGRRAVSRRRTTIPHRDTAERPPLP